MHTLNLQERLLGLKFRIARVLIAVMALGFLTPLASLTAPSFLSQAHAATSNGSISVASGGQLSMGTGSSGNPLPTQGATLETWVNFSNLASSNLIFKAWTYNTSYTTMDLTWSNGGVFSWHADQMSGSICTASSTTPVVGTWYHVALVVNSYVNQNAGTSSVYLNGNLVSTCSLSYQRQNGATQGVLMGGQSGQGQKFAEIRISSTARYSSSFTLSKTFPTTTDSNVLALFNTGYDSGNSTSCLTNSDPGSKGLTMSTSGTVTCSNTSPPVPPQVSSLTVSAGQKWATTQSTIVGANFTGVSAVTVGGVSVSYTFISDTSIAVTIPTSASEGAKNVVVTNADGQGTLNNGFTYLPNTFACSTSGSVTVTSAIALTKNSCVGNLDLTNSGLTTLSYGTFQNVTALTGITLPSTLSIIEGAALYNTGIATLTIPPSITSIGSQAVSGNNNLTTLNMSGSPTTSVTLSGYALGGNHSLTSVSFGIPAANTLHLTSFSSSQFLFQDDSSLSNIYFCDDGSGNNSYLANFLTTANSLDGSLRSNRFSNNPAGLATLSCPVPAIGSATITGSATVAQVLTATAASVTGSTPMFTSYRWQSSATSGGTYSDLSSTAATYTVASADLGRFIRVIITDTNTYGSASATSSSTSAVVNPPAPTITSLASISGPIGGGAVDTITGTNLSGTSAVLIGGVAATNVIVDSATSVHFTLPALKGTWIQSRSCCTAKRT